MASNTEEQAISVIEGGEESLEVTGGGGDPAQDRENSEETERLFQQAADLMDECNTDKVEGNDDANLAALCDKVAQLGGEKSPSPEESDVFRYKYIIVTDMTIPEASYEYEGILVEWLHVNKSTVPETQAEVMQLLDDPTPKNLIVWCFNKFILNADCTNMTLEALKLIRNRAKFCTTHFLTIADCLFVPSFEHRWRDISTYNFYVRNLNLSMLRNPLCPSKAFLKKVSHLPKLAVKGTCWLEHENSTGLGTTLSEDGLNKLRRWFGAHMVAGKEGVNVHTSSGKEESPAPLYETPGYKSDEMVNLLKSAGRYTLPDPPSVMRDKQRLAKLIGREYLRPNLASIRRFSTASSSSSGSRRAPYNRFTPGPSRQSSPRYKEEDVQERLKTSKLERDISDLLKEVKQLKESKEKEIEKRRLIEDRLYDRLDRLALELEWQGRERRNLEGKLYKLRDDLRYMKEDRDDLSKKLDQQRRK